MKTVLFVLLLVTLLPCGAVELRGEWRVSRLDDSHIALTGDYSTFLHERFKSEKTSLFREIQDKKMPGWQKIMRFDLGATGIIAEYRPQIVRALQQFDRIEVRDANGAVRKIRQVGYWFNPTGQARFPNQAGEEQLTQNAEIAHFLFLEFEEPLPPGKYAVSLATGEKIDFTCDPAEPIFAFKINQVGYQPQARRKYAYFGSWLGSAGALPVRQHAGKIFELCDADTGKAVFTGKVKMRPADPVNPSGVAFTGEETAELNFSEWQTPGKYFLRIAGIGQSETFAIDEKSASEAFYCHARGLFLKRCNSTEAWPSCSPWQTGLCHGNVYRGAFPPDIGHYKAAEKRDFGFFDMAGKSITVEHFSLINQNRKDWTEKISVAGGWHDAADHDRRPQHLSISGNLAAAYLLSPEKFIDGQLHIPESGNGIPDILDEARWGLEHLRRGQQENGGVGTWIEAGRHPRPGEYLPSDDKEPYFLSLATRGSTIEYAAYASMLAVALRKAGDRPGAELYLDSAKRAWDFAQNPENRSIRFYNYKLGGKMQKIVYREVANLPSELVLKAAVNLTSLTGDRSYLIPAEGVVKNLKEAIGKRSWRWPVFLWIELELAGKDFPEFEELRKLRREEIENSADTMLKQQENNYPYRIAWYGAKEGHVNTMSWGNCHPLNRALYLLAAHAFTGDKRYLDGAYLANDYHNGANASGTTLTSGLGRVFPVRFLDLPSYADGIPEFVPGITPYRYTYGVARDDVNLAHGLYYKKRLDLGFAGLSISLLPDVFTGGRELTVDESAALLGKVWPIWRRWGNVEAYSVPASEYTVSETIAPAAAATGLLQEKAFLPDQKQLNYRPAPDIRKLPGFAPLP